VCVNSPQFYIVDLYAHFSNQLDQRNIETLMGWARLALSEVGTVSIDPETLDVVVPKLSEVRLKKKLSDYASEIFVAIMASLITALIFKILFIP